MDLGFWVGLAAGTARELLFFACAGMLLCGVDDALFDLIWMGKGVRGRWKLAPVADLPDHPPLKFAIFIPLWRESDVIAPMMAHLLRCWPDDNHDVFLGCYPNDRATLAVAQALAAEHGNAHCIVNRHAGPSTKADNLNTIWCSLGDGAGYDAIVLHDAEDKVHADELRLYEAYLAQHDMVQIPVLPLPDRDSLWVAGHYADEFAEAHAKELPLRHALGVPVPSAGVGTAIHINLMRKLASATGLPFHADSITEDYELGWRAGLSGERTIFVRALGEDGSLIATKAYFPESLSAAIRQKTRWVLGIAWQGWDRLSGHIAELKKSRAATGHSVFAHWMLWRDRRAILSPLFLLAGYWGAILYAAIWIMGEAVPGLSTQALTFPPSFQFLFSVTTFFIFWRLVMRAYFVWREYGAAQAFASVPRILVSNAVAIVAGHRAMVRYLCWGRGAPQKWDKTDHRFDDAPRQS